MQHKWPEPAWIAKLPQDQQGPSRVRYFLNLAAAFCSERGSLTKLGDGIGVTAESLLAARSRGRVSPDLAVKIETGLGRDLFPRELFNDIFTIES